VFAVALNLQTALIAAGVALVAGSGLYLVGYFSGIRDGRIEQLKDTIAAEKARDKIDADTARLSDYDLCVSLGGLPDQCAELRGVGKTTPDQ
jgi:hypothetical protein